VDIGAATVRRLLEEVVSITDRASETRQDLLSQLGAALASTHHDRSRSWDRPSEDAYFDDGRDDDDRSDAGMPAAGDTLRCKTCGMQVRIERDCCCPHGAPRLECCGGLLR
jgi:hypothetical protein